MTLACTSCGEILDPDDDRCPYCGTLAPPRPGSSVFAHEAAEPHWGGEPTVVADPLAIPIRDPGDPGPASRGGSEGLPRPVLGALVVAAALALVAVVAALVTGGGGGDDVASDGGPAAMAPEDADEDVGARDTTSTTGATSTTASSTSSTTSTSTSTTTTSSSTTTTAPPSTGPGSVPVLPSTFRGGWVAQLSSVPASAGTASIEAAYARIRSDVPGAVAARSDEWPSMTPGYWVFVETGFGSEDAVRSFCSSVGRSGDACLPRELAGRR